MRDLIARKKKGQKVTTAQPAEIGEGKVIDLMDALRRSLAGKSGSSGSNAGSASARRKAKSVASAQSRSKRGAA